MKPSAIDSATSHPSFLALDRAQLGEAPPEVAAHLAHCEVCRSYVAEPQHAATALGFAALQRVLLERKPAHRAWLWAAAPLLTVACAVFLLMTRSAPNVPSAGDTYVGEKGFRSVWIYVKHGADVELWDGKHPLAPGDRVRLKIDPGSYRHVAVYALTDPSAPLRLFSGPLTPGQNLTLPDAWELDDSLLPEQLYVVFSDAEITPAWQEWQAGRVPRSVAVLPFSLPKVGAPGSDAGLRFP